MSKSKRERLEDLSIDVAKTLTDQGKLIEAGFAIFAHYTLKDAPLHQVADMRIAFMAGAQHLWASVFAVLDEGQEPTDDDMRRMDLVQREMTSIMAELSEAITPAKGHA